LLYINPGQRLCTRDGRRIGNAELICVIPAATDDEETFYQIQTERGFIDKLTEERVRQLFFTDDFE
jgi:hypothetical protein